MPLKTESANLVTTQKDFMDFISEACEEASPVRKEFLDVLQKEGTTPEELYELFCSWGYDCVSLADCTMLLQLHAQEATTGIDPDFLLKMY